MVILSPRQPALSECLKCELLLAAKSRPETGHGTFLFYPQRVIHDRGK